MCLATWCALRCTVAPVSDGNVTPSLSPSRIFQQTGLSQQHCNPPLMTNAQNWFSSLDDDATIHLRRGLPENPCGVLLLPPNSLSLLHSKTPGRNVGCSNLLCHDCHCAPFKREGRGRGVSQITVQQAMWSSRFSMERGAIHHWHGRIGPSRYGLPDGILDGTSTEVAKFDPLKRNASLFLPVHNPLVQCKVENTEGLAIKLSRQAMPSRVHWVGMAKALISSDSEIMNSQLGWADD